MNKVENRKKSIILMLLSALSFSIMGVMVKSSGDIPVFQKVFFRNFISLFIAISMVKKNNVSFFGKKENQKYLFGRAFCGLCGVVLYFYAITNLSLATSTILNKMSPFFVLIFSGLLLKEKVSKGQIMAVFIAFTGMILTVGLDLGGQLIPIIAGATSAVTAGFSYTLVRKLSDKESPSTVIFYFSLVSVVGTIPLLLANYAVPTVTEWIFLILTGVFAAAGQYGLTYAYRYAPASEVSIYAYSSIIFSMILGAIIWSEIPTILIVSGGLLIIFAGYINYRIIRDRKSLSK